ncbi:MAG: winged helix-turn-helix domain-containing protein [Candidatus Marsarchaeota archaeon]|nr:winged helix-turn-helix domain-containing protein [Candidatus Marsarchaeota archaeon]MCL5102444.1 winged helix-turn-helix domain-containing protein [Candidatus Marsarchaeota archaeon]
MSKTFGTKKRILNLLKNGNMNLTEISAALGLSKATVSQHLSELEGMSMIEPIDNSHYKKVKYYRLLQKAQAPNQNEGVLRGSRAASRVLIPIVVAIAAIIIISGIALNGNHAPIKQITTTINSTAHANITTTPSLNTSGLTSEACPAIIINKSENVSDMQNTVSEIALGDPCALAEVSNGQISGYSYSSSNGTVIIPAFNYTYTINQTAVNNLKQGLDSGYCTDAKAMQFFGINATVPSGVACKNRIFN